MAGHPRQLNFPVRCLLPGVVTKASASWSPCFSQVPGDGIPAWNFTVNNFPWPQVAPLALEGPYWGGLPQWRNFATNWTTCLRRFRVSFLWIYGLHVQLELQLSYGFHLSAHDFCWKHTTVKNVISNLQVSWLKIFNHMCRGQMGWMYMNVYECGIVIHPIVWIHQSIHQ